MTTFQTTPDQRFTAYRGKVSIPRMLMTILVLSTEKPTTLSVLPVVRAVETKLMQALAAPQMGANRQ
ncbi:hypothetical protein PSCICG_40120 [Pseudomonas cichorii]|nr:hypothetical protein PSCICG_40120 [Pseudomonas cichorii]